MRGEERFLVIAADNCLRKISSISNGCERKNHEQFTRVKKKNKHEIHTRQIKSPFEQKNTAKTKNHKQVTRLKKKHPNFRQDR